MKKQPGMNGDWMPVNREERLGKAALPTIVTLGTPAAIQLAASLSPEPATGNWVLPLVFWIYGLLFWFTSTAGDLFKRQRWVWTEEALAEQRRFISDARAHSQAFWAHWWVRFPIGALFLSTGIYALMSKDFTLQWISFVLLLSAFITPFVFMVELALLPLSIGLVAGLMALVTLMPVALIVMLGFVGMIITIIMMQNQRSRMPPPPHNYLKPLDGGKLEKNDTTAKSKNEEPMTEAETTAAAPEK
jgi:hypothetical protein